MKLTSLLTMAAAMLISANSYAANSEAYKYGDESPINQNDKNMLGVSLDCPSAKNNQVASSDFTNTNTSGNFNNFMGTR